MMNKDIIREIARSQQYVISLYNLTDLMEIYDYRPDHVWPFPTPPYLYFETNPEHQRGTRFWASWSAVLECLEGKNTRYSRENYEINWRCWKGIPTDQQRAQRLWLNKQDESSANDTPVLSEAQEPRVMTLEDMWALKFNDVVIIEQNITPLLFPAIVIDNIKRDCNLEVLQIVTAAMNGIANADYDYYGKRWRCWSSRPDQATREAVKWDG